MARNIVDWIALVLVIVGAINWGLFAFGYDLVAILVGSWSAMAAQVVYALVGLAGIYMIYGAFKS